MSKPTTFEAIEQKQRRRGSGCPRCGADRNAGQVNAQLQSLGSGGTLTSGKRVRSKAVSMCEPCAVAVYLVLEETLLRETKVGEMNA